MYLLNFPKINLWKLITKFTFAAIILSLILGYIFGKSGGYLGSGPGGAQGFKITEWMNSFAGKSGTGIILLFTTIAYLIFALRFKPETFTKTIPGSIKNIIPGINANTSPIRTGSDLDVESGDRMVLKLKMSDQRMRKKWNLCKTSPPAKIMKPELQPRTNRSHNR